MKKEKGAGAAVIVIIIVLLLLVCGVILIISSGNSDEGKVVSTVEETFKKMKTGDVSDINVDSSSNSSMDYLFMFSKLSYNIISKDVKSDEATIVMDVTNKDMKVVLNAFLAKSFSIAMSQGLSSNYSKEQLQEQLKEELKNIVESDQVDFVTTRLTLKMKKVNNEWKVLDECKKDFTNAVLPNFLDATNSISNLFSGESN